MQNASAAKLTISKLKSAIEMPEINIVEMICDYDERHFEEKKVQKILNWPAPRNLKQAREFVEIVVYYRIFIEGFAIIAAPIYILFRKERAFI